VIEEEVLRRIKPTHEDTERIKNAIKIILERLNQYNIEIHGSFAKDTWLKQDTDIDIFLFFDYNLGKNFLKNIVYKLREKLQGIETKLAYAEHPYLIALVNNIEVDIVPAFRVKSGREAITAVDRTPFHTHYVKNHLSESQKDEVRLLKQFMKGIGVYGAEIKVEGFSGYVTELLIIYYGSFREVLKNAAKWIPPVKLEIVKAEKEFNSPLIIPDPVDPRRNAASAVSLRKLAEFSLASRYYLKEPSLEFFFPSTIEYKEIKGDVLLVNISVKETSADVFWGQVKRSMRKIRKALELSGFKVIDIEAWGEENNATIGIQLESKIIGEYYTVKGPPFYISSHVDKFILENENIWVGQDGRLYAIKRRKDIDVLNIVKKSISVDNAWFEFNWLNSPVNDPWIMKFLRKRPNWLK
jgi:tRNA nucleotidyltransferase (CCA-adding enzyme)